MSLSVLWSKLLRCGQPTGLAMEDRQPNLSIRPKRCRGQRKQIPRKARALCWNLDRAALMSTDWHGCGNETKGHLYSAEFAFWRRRWTTS